MRASNRPAAPLRQLARLVALATGVLVLLHAGDLEAGSTEAGVRLPGAVRADTDSVALDLDDEVLRLSSPTAATDTTEADTAAADTAAADTTEADSTARARYLLPATPRETFYAVPVERLVPSLLGGRVRARTQTIELDSALLQYRVRETIGNEDIRTPIDVSLEDYLAAQLEANREDGFRQILGSRIQREQRRAGVGFNIDIPGGEGSAFTTIFGKNEVDLRVTGNSTLDIGAGYDQNALQQASTGRDGSFAPDFGQQLNLNVAGTIGDKLRINVNYDTQSQFDFENQVSLVYTGYEDDIIQTIEAGNVFLQTPSELIRGGQRLFGLRTDLQFGPLSLTAVASQQDAESDEVVIEGGSQATTFSLVPTRYEDDTHFFLGFAFYNWWNAAHADPTVPTSPPGMGSAGITGLKVWVQDAQANNATSSTEDRIWGTALVDLGEPELVLDGGRGYLDAIGEAAPLPEGSLDQYEEADLVRLRANEVTDYAQDYGLGEGDYKTGQWRLLNEGSDYVFDPNLGWLSLTGPLGPDDALAVTYQYRSGTGPVTVGDFQDVSQSGTSTGARTLLKLVRDNAPVPTDAAWDLTMRNIYRVGGRSLNPRDLDLQVTYEQPGSAAPQRILPGVQISDGLTLLQALGLDRTNDAGLPPGDNIIDFRPGYTVDARSGRIIFPVREPFGRYMEGLLRDGAYVNGTEVGVTIASGYEAVASDFVFPEMYELKRDVAERELNKLSRYAIEGEYRGASQSVFNVGFGLVEGSVSVQSGGVDLVEGTDYIVNETAGTVEIRNPLYLAPDKEVTVRVERNQLFSIGSKTVVGLRGDYRISEQAGLGATWMRLAERPLTDKFRIGEEALRNSIVGLDGGVTYEPRWVTRVLDGLPLIQTRAPSSFEIRGEIAQFSPGHPETFAFRQVQRDLNAIGRELAPDERTGISSIDDFEGAENINTALEQAPGWRIAAPPRGAGPANVISYVPGASITDPRLATSWRGLLGWYSISTTAYDRLGETLGGLPLAASKVFPQELFPGRNFSPNERAQPLTLLDVYFDPSRRGPYNYNREFATTFQNDPATAWGGMTRSLDAAYADFNGANTVESIEFLFSPLGGRDGTEAISPGAVMYIDLGILNEDTIPNSALNSEDGLTEAAPDEDELDDWGRLLDGQANNSVDVFDTTGRTEDLGLDGLPSSRDLVADGGTPYEVSEADLPGAIEFIGALPEGPERRRALLDPAGDDYHNFQEDVYFDDNGLFPGRASAQERYAHYYAGSELNTTLSRNQVLPGRENGISQIPSTEDINNNFSTTKVSEERFFRYALPLDDAGLQASPYFTGSTIEASGSTWYLIRIPVLDESRIDEGGDLSNVEMVRVWTTGHQRPATLRFATFELVGSQWLKSNQTGIVDEVDEGSEPELFIASINTDENPRQYLTPVSAQRPVARDVNGQIRDAREQSLVFRLEGLSEGQARALYKPFTTRRQDLTRYSNVRMFIHGEGFEVEDSVRVFMRMGSDETENYYEIEQPLYPAESASVIDAFGDGDNFLDVTAAADYLWQTNACPGGDDPEGDGAATRTDCTEADRLDLNSINVVLSELNQLKVSRDLDGAPITERYTLGRRPEGAPPGTRLSIVGTPSIQSISTIVVGVRNGAGGDATPLNDVEVWFNELRVTGYDEEGGRSGFVTAQARLADVASANARVSFSQDGFGSLGGGLGERDYVDRLGFTFSSTFNAHKLVPERFGWNAPVQVSIQENESTPRFDPTNSDIRIDDLVQRALLDESVSEPQREISADSIRAAAQTIQSQRTFRVPISKSGSRSPWLKYTLDGLNLSYTNTSSEGRSPRQLLSTNDTWRVDASYRLNVPRPRTVRPFWWTGGIPLLGSALEGVRFDLLPRSLSVSANTGRTVTVSRERPLAADLSQPDLVNDFLYPRRTTHDFGHTRSVNLQYRPLTFLNLSYGANSTQSLDIAGVDERFSVLVRDTAGVFGERGRIQQFNLSRDAAAVPGSQVWEAFGVATEEEYDQLQILGGTTPQLDVVPWADAVGATLGGYRDLLTERYDQTFTSSFTISTRRVKWLSWVQPQPISFNASYAWNFQPITGLEDQTIAGVGTSVQVNTGLRLRPKEFWRLFPFYRSLEESAQRARQDADRRRREREAERQRRRQMEDDAALSGAEGAEGPSEEAPAQQVQQDQEEPEADRAPLIDFVGIGRRILLAVTGTDDLQVTYRGAFQSTGNGVVGDGFSFLAGVTGNAPPLSYRLGLDRRLPLRSRLSSPTSTLQLQDVLGDDHQIEGRTSIELTPTLRVSFTATTSWDRNETYPIERTGDLLVEQDPILRGSGSSTVFAIPGSYEALLSRHEDRYRRDIAGASNDDGSFTSAAGSASGLTSDFAQTFGRGLGTFGPDGLFRIPLPSWEVSWSGLNRWPLLRSLTQSVTVQHSYFASSDAQYESFDILGDRFRNIGGVSLLTPVSEVEPTTYVVNERFQPLIGVRVGWKGSLQTELTWNRSRVLTLQPASAYLVQKEVGDLQANISFSKTGFRLPFMSRLRNTIRLTLTASLSDDQTRNRYIVEDLEDRLNGDPLEDPAPQRFQRVSFWPRVGYQISNRVNMDVFFRYEQSLNQGATGSPRLASYDGGVTLRISFSN
ncbi:MAG: cell surface protein SprA [Bacteroidota bacterium]